MPSRIVKHWQRGVDAKWFGTADLINLVLNVCPNAPPK